MILKAPRSVYEKGRSREWLKLKAQANAGARDHRLDAGKGKRRRIARRALLLAVADGKGGYEFAGKVGTGFSSKQRKELQKELAKDERADLAGARRAPAARRALGRAAPRRAGAVHRVDARREAAASRVPGAARGQEARGVPCARSRLRRRRAPRRRKKRRAEARRRQAGASADGAAAQKLTNPDRVLYPKDGITKADVAAYYEAVAPALPRRARGPAADARSTGTRASRGRAGSSRTWARRAEEWMRIVETPARTKKQPVRHLVADGPRALRWLAQNSVLEIHAWHSRAPTLTQPDWVVFDLDPAEGETIEQALEVARCCTGCSSGSGCPAFPRRPASAACTSSCRWQKGHTYEDAEAFAVQVGETVAKQLKNVTLERSLSARRGRLYFDCMQNAYGKTVVAPYSLRGVDGAPVSTPLRWSGGEARARPEGVQPEDDAGAAAEGGRPLRARRLRKACACRATSGDTLARCAFSSVRPLPVSAVKRPVRSSATTTPSASSRVRCPATTA